MIIQNYEWFFLIDFFLLTLRKYLNILHNFCLSTTHIFLYAQSLRIYLLDYESTG